jgi:hypothetical protein
VVGEGRGRLLGGRGRWWTRRGRLPADLLGGPTRGSSWLQPRRWVKGEVLGAVCEWHRLGEAGLVKLSGAGG